MYVDGTNNPKIPVGEIHSTKTFSPKIQLNLPKNLNRCYPFFCPPQRTPAKAYRQSSKDRQKPSPLFKNKPLVKPKGQSLPFHLPKAGI